MNTAITIDGTVRPDGSLEVNGRLTLNPGPVRITIEPLAVQPGEKMSFDDLTALMVKLHHARGGVSRTREEVDAELNAMRDEAEEEMQAIERIQEEAARCRQAQGSQGSNA